MYYYSLYKNKKLSYSINLNTLFFNVLNHKNHIKSYIVFRRVFRFKTIPTKYVYKIKIKYKTNKYKSLIVVKFKRETRRILEGTKYWMDDSDEISIRRSFKSSVHLHPWLQEGFIRDPKNLFSLHEKY